MSRLDLPHLGRTAFSLSGSRGVSVENLGTRPATVHLNVKGGAWWTPWSGNVTLQPRGRWWAARAAIPAEEVSVVVVAGGAGAGRGVVRVEY